MSQQSDGVFTKQGSLAGGLPGFLPSGDEGDVMRIVVEVMHSHLDHQLLAFLHLPSTKLLLY